MSYKGRDRGQRINLWLHGEHYDVIKSLKGFHGSHFYCETCERAYDRLEDHYCPDKCNICLRSVCNPDEPKRCPECDRLCKSEDCFFAHKARSGNQEFSICDRVRYVYYFLLYIFIYYYYWNMCLNSNVFLL